MRMSRLVHIAGSVSCIVFAVVLAFAFVPAGEASAGETPGAFVLPAGNAAAGEAVFIKLQCSACHNVSGMSFGERKGEPIGPELSPAHAAKSREAIASRLISYDRFLSEGLYKGTYSRSDGSSRMGNFNDAMTVRELIDLVEFVKSIT